MALPTITNNSPGAGQIAWTTFNIQYNGQSFNIPAGNTAQKYVWWLYNGGTAPALQAGNAFPALGPDDMVLFLNKAGIGVLVPTAELLDGSLIVGGSILAAAIGANEIQTTHLSANSVTATQLAANSVYANNIAAGQITADKLSVGTVSDNMVINGSFEDALSGYLVGWEAYTISNGTIQPVTGVSSSGAVAMQLVCTNTSANLRVRQLPAQYIPVSAASGRKYYISTRAGASTATTGGHYMRVNWYDGNKAFISSVDVRSNGSLTTTFTLYEGQATPPATAKYMGMEMIITNVNVATTVYIDEVSAHEVTMSAQIGDGQITTPKILANAVTATTIAAGAVTAKHLVISDFTNLIQDPLLIRPVGEVWTRRSGASTASTVVSTVGGEGNSWKLDGVGTEVSVVTDFIEIQPDQEYLISFLTQQALTGTSAYGYMRITWYKKDKVTTVGSDFSTTVFASGWVPSNTTLTVPLTAYYCKVYWIHGASATGGNWWVANPSMRRMNGGELIVDGAVIAAKIATDAVTSDKIIANAITAAKINADAVVAGKIAANAISAREIQANTIVSNLVAADQILGNHILAGEVDTYHLAAESITADKLESDLVLATKIIAGDPGRTHAEMSDDGFRVFTRDPAETNPAILPTEAIRLGVDSTDDYFSVLKADGTAVASIDQNGTSSFQQVYARDAMYYKGMELTDWVNEGRLVARGYRNTSSVYNASYGGSTQPYFRLDRVPLKAGNLYRVYTGPVRMDHDANTMGYTTIWYSFSASDPNVQATVGGSSASIAETVSDAPPVRTSDAAMGLIAPTQDGWGSFLFSFASQGPGQVGLRSSTSAPFRMLVENLGRDVGTSGIYMDGTAPPPPAVNNYTKQYGCNSIMNYQGNNSQYNYDTSHMYQGLSPAGYGNLKSLGLFPDMTADLSGATVTAMRMFWTFPHWYYNSGGTARIGVHGNTSIPGTWAQYGNIAVASGIPKPGNRWINIDSSHWANFKNGTYRGLTLEGDNTYGTYGYANAPVIEISYTK